MPSSFDYSWLSTAANIIEIPNYYYHNDGSTIHMFHSKEELDKYLANKPKKKVWISISKGDDPGDDRIFILNVNEKKSYIYPSHYLVINTKHKLNRMNNEYGVRLGIHYTTKENKEV